jgi:hypothetical protein
MDESRVRALLAHYWKHAPSDPDTAHQIYHDDAVLEFPQSGERFVGVAHFREWRRIYPAKVTLEVRHLRGSGSVWVAEYTVSYDGGPPKLGVSILELRGDKIARERIYITEPWEAAAWRAPWRAKSDANDPDGE